MCDVVFRDSVWFLLCFLSLCVFVVVGFWVLVGLGWGVLVAGVGCFWGWGVCLWVVDVVLLCSLGGVFGLFVGGCLPVVGVVVVFGWGVVSCCGWWSFGWVFGLGLGFCCLCLWVLLWLLLLCFFVFVVVVL